MGNNSQGLHNLSQCVNYSGSHFQIHLLDVTPQIPVLLSYYHSKSLVFVTDEGVESFNSLVKIHEYFPIKGCYISACFFNKENLFIAENTGILKILDLNTLQVTSQIKPTKLLPGRITCIIEGLGNLYLGHVSGDITVWKASDGSFVGDVPGCSQSPVESLKYSQRYHLLIPVTSGAQTKVRIIGVKKKYERSLQGIVQKCLGVLVIDDKNLILGLDSYNNQIVLWDIITGSLLVTAMLPEFFPLSRVTCISSTGLSATGFAIGFTSNSVVWGDIIYNQDNCCYCFEWKGRAKSSTEGNVVSICYSDEINGLLINSDKCLILELSNLNRQVKIIQQKKPMFAISEYEESNEYCTNIKVYRRTPTNKSSLINESTLKKIRDRIDGKKIISQVEESKDVDDTYAERHNTHPEPKETTDFDPNLHSKCTESQDKGDSLSIISHEGSLNHIKHPQDTDIQDIKGADTKIEYNYSQEPQNTHIKGSEEVKTQASSSVNNENPEPEPPKPLTAPSGTEVKTASEKKPVNSFQIFLKLKKPEFLKENPAATHKEIVLKATQAWSQLTEFDKKQYETE
jgi:HMG (high mobility group) box